MSATNDKRAGVHGLPSTSRIHKHTRPGSPPTSSAPLRISTKPCQPASSFREPDQNMRLCSGGVTAGIVPP